MKNDHKKALMIVGFLVLCFGLKRWDNNILTDWGLGMVILYFLFLVYVFIFRKSTPAYVPPASEEEIVTTY